MCVTFVKSLLGISFFHQHHACTLMSCPNTGLAPALRPYLVYIFYRFSTCTSPVSCLRVPSSHRGWSVCAPRRGQQKRSTSPIIYFQRNMRLLIHYFDVEVSIRQSRIRMQSNISNSNVSSL